MTSPVLALPILFDAVCARFRDDETNVPNLFGWNESDKKLTRGDRITWAPGDGGGSLGAMNPARNPGGNPRPLATLEELFTVEVLASDKDQPESELGAYTAARLLFDAWYRAVYLAAHGTFRVLSCTWLTDQKVRRYGAGIRVICAIQAKIPDAPMAVAPVDTKADLTVELLDVSESIEVLPTDT